MKARTALLGLMAAYAPLQVNALETVLVTDGDVAALRLAIENANLRTDEQTEILLAGDFHFTDRLPMPVIIADISLRSFNQRARLLGPAPEDEEADHPRTLFQVGVSGRLLLRNLEIADITLALDGEGLIRNAGRLEIEQTVVSNVTGAGFCLNFGRCSFAQPMIVNGSGGELVLEKVSFRDSGGRHLSFNSGSAVLDNDGQASLVAVQMVRTDAWSYWSTPIVNQGALDINSSSFFDQAQSTAHSLPLLIALDAAAVTIGNSIIAGFNGAGCEQATSLGNNLHEDGACGWDSAGDLVGAAHGLGDMPLGLEETVRCAQSLEPCGGVHASREHTDGVVVEEPER